MYRVFVALAAAIIVAAGCNPIYTSYDYDKDADFDTYETYSWLIVPDTIASDEVLPIQLWGTTLAYPNGQHSLSRTDAVRKSTEIELTVWAEVEVWTGSAPPPPYATSVYVVHEAEPPFDPGDFRVVIDQPDSSQLVKTVLVEP